MTYTVVKCAVYFLWPADIKVMRNQALIRWVCLVYVQLMVGFEVQSSLCDSFTISLAWLLACHITTYQTYKAVFFRWIIMLTNFLLTPNRLKRDSQWAGCLPWAVKCPGPSLKAASRWHRMTEVSGPSSPPVDEEKREISPSLISDPAGGTARGYHDIIFSMTPLLRCETA